jgi:hypothetical protein
MKITLNKNFLVIICICLSLISAAGVKQELERCAAAGETCKFTGFKIVKYGTGDKFNYNAFKGPVECNTLVMGEPHISTVFSKKACEIPKKDYYWVYCAKENAKCNFTGSRFVRYGVEGGFNYRQANGGVDCNNANLGDPKLFKQKHCHYSEDFEPGKFEWKSCSKQNGVCNFRGTQLVRYGKDDSWSYMQATGSISCNDDTFADSNKGPGKECQYNMVDEDSCTDGLVLNAKQCVKSCPPELFVTDDNKCAEKCPEKQFYVSGTKKCLLKCPKSHNAVGSECTTCEKGKVSSFDGLSCVIQCPHDQFLILGTNTCYAHCPTYYKTNLERNECLFNCSDNNLFTSVDGAHCISKCPADQVELCKTCLYDCPTGYFNHKNTCVLSCPEDTFISTDGKRCLSECPGGQYTEKIHKRCYNQCPNNYFINGVECIICCPEGTFKSFESENRQCLAKCPDGQFVHKTAGVCYSFCPVNLFINGNECVEKCPTGTVLDAIRRNCLSACPTGQVLIPEISICYDSCPFNYRKEGNNCILITKPKI